MMLVLVVVFVAVTAVSVWYGRHLRRRITKRLAASSGGRESGESRKESRRTIRAFPPRRRFLVPITGVAAGALLWLGAELPLEVAAAGGLLIAVLARLLDDFESGRQSTIIEQQLAAAIYIMVGSLRAGASLLAAFDSALQEVKPPLRPYFKRSPAAFDWATTPAQRSAICRPASRSRRSGSSPHRSSFIGKSAAVSPPRCLR